MKSNSAHFPRRRSTHLAIAAGVLALAFGLLGAGAASASAATCTWGGTTLAPTGTFHFDAPLTTEPSPTAIGFWASGVLAGPDAHCTKPNGKPRMMTFIGQFLPGASCAFFYDEGSVSGVPGVVSFEGSGTGYTSGYMYDNRGKVGTYDAQVFSNGVQATLDCGSTGFPTDGLFSSVLGVSFSN
jgi:hypothetical protein